MKIAIDCDSAGLNLKAALLVHIRAAGLDITDLDYLATHAVDYPDVAVHLAQQVAAGHYDRGILLCGTGLGVAMSACKVPGIYAATCHDVFSAERARKSNAAQIITLGERVIGTELAKMVVDAWLRSEFAGGDSERKIRRMHELEKQQNTK